MDERNIGSIETKVTEECVELIKALCKADRFGLFNYNPHDPEMITNLDKILAKIEDVMDRCREYKEILERFRNVSPH